MDLGELDLSPSEDEAPPSKENKDVKNARDLKDDSNLDDELESGLDSESPFPPGYADDLFE